MWGLLRALKKVEGSQISFRRHKSRAFSTQNVSESTGKILGRPTTLKSFQQQLDEQIRSANPNSIKTFELMRRYHKSFRPSLELLVSIRKSLEPKGTADSWTRMVHAARYEPSLAVDCLQTMKEKFGFEVCNSAVFATVRKWALSSGRRDVESVNKLSELIEYSLLKPKDSLDLSHLMSTLRFCTSWNEHQTREFALFWERMLQDPQIKISNFRQIDWSNVVHALSHTDRFDFAWTAFLKATEPPPTESPSPSGIQPPSTSAQTSQDSNSEEISENGEEAQQKEDQQRQKGPNAPLIGKMFAMCVRCQKWKELVQIYDLWKTSQLPISLNTFTHVITTLIKLNAPWSQITDVLGHMDQSKISPDLFLYSEIMEYLTAVKQPRISRSKTGEKENCRWLLRSMRERNVRPDGQLFCLAVAVLGDADEALALFNTLKKEGMQPTRDVYATLLGMFSKLGDMRTCEYLIEQMKIDGISPHLECYTHMLNCCSKMLRGEETPETKPRVLPHDKWISEMLKSQFPLDAFALSAALSACKPSGDMTLAWELYNRFTAAMVEATAEAEDHHHQSLSSSSPGKIKNIKFHLSPNRESAEIGAEESEEELFSDRSGSGSGSSSFAPHPSVFVKLVEVASVGGSVKDLERIEKEMEKFNVQSDHIISARLSFFGKKQFWSDFEREIKRMIIGSCIDPASTPDNSNSKKDFLVLSNLLVALGLALPHVDLKSPQQQEDVAATLCRYFFSSVDFEKLFLSREGQQMSTKDREAKLAVIVRYLSSLSSHFDFTRELDRLSDQKLPLDRALFGLYFSPVIATTPGGLYSQFFQRNPTNWFDPKLRQPNDVVILPDTSIFLQTPLVGPLSTSQTKTLISPIDELKKHAVAHKGLVYVSNFVQSRLFSFTQGQTSFLRRHSKFALHDLSRWFVDSSTNATVELSSFSQDVYWEFQAPEIAFLPHGKKKSFSELTPSQLGLLKIAVGMKASGVDVCVLTKNESMKKAVESVKHHRPMCVSNLAEMK